MAAQGLLVSKTLGAGIRAEMDASRVYAEPANGVSNLFLQRQTKLLAREELPRQRIVEEKLLRYFPKVPLALLTSRFSAQISYQTDRERLIVKEVLSRAVEQWRTTRDFGLEPAPNATDLTGRHLEPWLLEGFLKSCGTSCLF